MQNLNKWFVRTIANVAPYLAPIPSAYFVTRAGILHLGLPPIIGAISGLIIETLGFSSVHTWLMLTNWNNRSKRNDPKAPSLYAFVLVLIYLVVTISLTILLEIFPDLSLFAPALFPFLALIGAINLVLNGQQEQREIEVKNVHIERLEKRRLNTKYINQNEQLPPFILTNSDTNLDKANATRKRNKETTLNTILGLVNEYPNIGVTELAKATGIKSRTTIYNYLSELRNSGKLNSTIMTEK